MAILPEIWRTRIGAISINGGADFLTEADAHGARRQKAGMVCSIFGMASDAWRADGSSARSERSTVLPVA